MTHPLTAAIAKYERLGYHLDAGDVVTAARELGLLHHDGTPPQAVRDAFRQGLALHAKGKSGKGLEGATVREARAIAEGKAPTPAKVSKAVRWFARNARFADAPKDSPAYAAWMLWGGEAGRQWFEELAKEDQ